MDHFKDKVIIVTGGASGIGRSLCEQLGQQEAVIIVADINFETANQVAQSINDNDGRAYAVHLDVTNKDEVQKVIDEAIDKYNRIDFMFNNAGIVILGDQRDMTPEYWTRTLDVNLMGVIYGTTIAYSTMVKQGFGHIINTASVAGLYPFPMEIPYTTSKFAVVGLSTSLRSEAAGLGVKVSIVCPGPVMTNIYNTAITLKFTINDLFEKLPPRMMSPDKAAKIILRGVARNKSFIVFPFFFRILWWLYRIHPVLLNPLLRQIVKFYRKLRQET